MCKSYSVKSLRRYIFSTASSNQIVEACSTPEKPTKSRQQKDNNKRVSHKQSFDSTTPTEKTKIEKFVSFANHATARYTIALSDYSPEEIEATWYTEDESQERRKECIKQIRRLESGRTLKDKKYCATQIGRAHVLNSSHTVNSYAVFCLKKKKQEKQKEKLVAICRKKHHKYG